MVAYQANANFVIVPIQQQDDESLAFLVKDPASHRTLELGPEEYFIYQLLAANVPLDKIATRFYTKFQSVVMPADLSSFADTMLRQGLLKETTIEPLDIPVQLPDEVGLGEPDLVLPDVSVLGRPTVLPQDYQKSLFNPQPFFRTVSWLAPFFHNLYWCLLAGVPAALLTLFHNGFDIFQDSVAIAQQLPSIAILLTGMWGVNLASKLVQGITVVALRGAVNEFGISFLLGWVPVFYIRYPGILGFSRTAQLSVFAAPLLFRLLVFTFGLLFWALTRTSSTFLPLLALMISQATLTGFFLDASPVWKSNGYRWLSIYFRAPRLFDQAWQIFEILIVRRKWPQQLGAKQKRILLIYGAIALTSWIGLFAIAIGIFAVELEANLEGVGVILFLILLTLTIRWVLSMIRPSLENNGGEAFPHSHQTALSSLERKISEVPRTDQVWGWLRRHKYYTMGALGLVVLSLIPYPYRPGGSVVLITPQQLDIQANISGKIEDVYIEGGTGETIPSGTVLATIQPSKQINFGTPIENDRAVYQERISSYEATVSQREAELAKLLNTPLAEDVEIAERALDTAEADLMTEHARLPVVEQEAEAAKQKQVTLEQEINVSRQQIEKAMVSVDYDQREADRLRSLYEQGAITLQSYENSTAKAETSQVAVAEAEERLRVNQQQVVEQQQAITIANRRTFEQRQNIKVLESTVEEDRAKLKAVKKGPHPDEIESARQALSSAKAALREQKQGLIGIDQQLQENQIKMSFAGQITTPFLTQKVGSYIEQGETFASIENSGTIQGKISIPESEADLIRPDGSVEVKLSAYATHSFDGRVLSIEPTTSEERDRRFVTVIVEIFDSETLITGMSGYAKVKGQNMPLIFAFSRPIIRFIQVEVWSWIP